jgi:hypothetical protein
MELGLDGFEYTTVAVGPTTYRLHEVGVNAPAGPVIERYAGAPWPGGGFRR